jgi:hypothetical protein
MIYAYNILAVAGIAAVVVCQIRETEGEQHSAAEPITTMMKLIRELRRREVFRTAGLYVGIAWILIEGASVLLDAFEAPDWILRGMIIVAIIGLPVTIVLA